jgi:acetylornithine/N-succinyldiaminopimelate aminotransferase
MNQREIFLRHVAQTSAAPLGLEIVAAKGCLLYDVQQKEYIDLIGGISVANIGHRHPGVVAAIREQVDAYLHVMVYGEFIEAPQVKFAKRLAENLPPSLSSVFFTNSGAEATEGAMKLAKRATNRTGIVAFHNSYHGSTQGALSLMGDEYWRNAFRPLLPGILHCSYNSAEALACIDESIACVVAETVQAEAGVIAPAPEWLQSIRDRCTKTGALLILDEIQAGFGRTGRLWGFEHFGIVPDILLLGKALGGGMPLGAFIADRKLMSMLSDQPVLGHLTTFGGHPVCCAAGLAALNALLSENILDGIGAKEALFLSLLVHPLIRSVRSFGLWLALEFETADLARRIIDQCIRNGVLTDWFLFAPGCLRISPPLVISKEEIKQACDRILQACDDSSDKR